jgi:tRNA uridine 5-carboxymethylaminomethyl modification enzyme
MFTSRAEFRLLLRQDNARQRLLPVISEVGLQPPEVIQKIESGLAHQAALCERLLTDRIRLEDESIPAAQYLRRPEVSLNDPTHAEMWSPELWRLIQQDPDAAFQAEMEIKYEGYLARQQVQVDAFRRLEEHRLPTEADYLAMSALSAEARQVLSKQRPATLGHASRLPGVRSADLAVLLILLKRRS